MARTLPTVQELALETIKPPTIAGRETAAVHGAEQLPSRAFGIRALHPTNSVTNTKSTHFMQIAKLSTGKVVRFLKPAQRVAFDVGLFVLVCDRLTLTPSRIDPYWVPAATVVWVIEF